MNLWDVFKTFGEVTVFVQAVACVAMAFVLILAGGQLLRTCYSADFVPTRARVVAATEKAVVATFEFNGEKYTRPVVTMLSGRTYREGDVITLAVNAKDPNKVILQDPSTHSNGAAALVSSAVCLMGVAYFAVHYAKTSPSVAIAAGTVFIASSFI
jgi:hypothetical protein